MPKIKVDRIVTFTSEDPIHEACNVLSTDPAKKWKCQKVGEKDASIVLQLEQASAISGIDIGNEHSAYVEVLVARSNSTSDDYKVLLVMSSFMSPTESRQSTNVNKVRMFGYNELQNPERDQKWDRVKIVCIQPFNRHVQYGLSFITLHGPGSKETAASNAPIKLGKFSLRPDSPDNLTSGSLFARRKELADDAPLSVIKIKTKSKNINDQFQKSLNKGKSGDPVGKKKRQYMQSESLEFLRHSLEKRPTSENIEDVEEQESQRSPSESSFSAEDDSADDLPTEEPSTSNTSPTLVKRPAASRSKKSGNRALMPFQSSLLKRTNQASERMPAAPEDPDRAYLLSLLPSFKKLTEGNKWRFRQTVADFFLSLDANSSPQAQQPFQDFELTLPRPATSQTVNNPFPAPSPVYKLPLHLSYPPVQPSYLLAQPSYPPVRPSYPAAQPFRLPLTQPYYSPASHQTHLQTPQTSHSFDSPSYCDTPSPNSTASISDLPTDSQHSSSDTFPIDSEPSQGDITLINKINKLISNCDFVQ